MMDEGYLGWLLTDALADLRGAGRPLPRVIETCDPRHGGREGEKRVIRVRPGEWTVAVFLRDQEEGGPSDPGK